MTQYAGLTPQEVDTKLAELWAETQKYEIYAASERSTLGRPQRYSRFSLEDAAKRLAEYEARVATLRAEAAPYENEYNARRWNRYFLVTNSNGHVHRGMNCVTCFDSTQYAWLPDLSGCVESDAIEEFGEKMCTVCFPDAPSDPRFRAPGRRDAAAKAEREAERAERQAKKDAKNLAPELQFRDLGGWKITTVAGAKQALRDCVYTQTVAGTIADYNDYEAGRLPKAGEIFDTAVATLQQKGVPQAEIDKVIANAKKKAEKET